MNESTCKFFKDHKVALCWSLKHTRVYLLQIAFEIMRLPILIFIAFIAHFNIKRYDQMRITLAYSLYTKA